MPKPEVLEWVAKDLIGDSDDSVDSDDGDDERFLSARGSEDEGASVASDDHKPASGPVSPDGRGEGGRILILRETCSYSFSRCPFRVDGKSPEEDQARRWSGRGE